MIPMTNSVYFRDKAYIFGGRHNEVRYSYIFDPIIYSSKSFLSKAKGLGNGWFELIVL